MREDVKYVHDMVQQAGGLLQIDKAILLIQEHLDKTHLNGKGELFVSKNYRLSLWKPSKEEVYKLIIEVFTTTLTHDYLTYQALVGKHHHSIPMDNPLDQIKTMAEVIAMLCIADLIDIIRSPGEYHQIKPRLVLKDIPLTDRHGTVYHRPQPVESNYDPEQGNMILGGRLNYHEESICLDYINKMNRIPMALNKEFLLKYPEEPKKPFTNSPDTVTGESGMTAEEKAELWQCYAHDCRKRYAHALVCSDKLYLNHKPDTRGRMYAVGYYISTQGSSYKKASLQFANKEYLDDTIAFPKNID